MGKIVTDVKEINVSKDIYGPYSRRKVQVTTLENNQEQVNLKYLDENEILEILNAYISYLNHKMNNGTRKKRNLTSQERMEKNMKATPFYAVGFVLIILSILSSEVIGIPLFLVGVVTTLLTTIKANDLIFYKKIKATPEYLEFEKKMEDANRLTKEAEYEIERKPNMDEARSRIEENARNCKQNIVSKIAIQNAIEDLRYRAIRQKWHYYEDRKRNHDDDLGNDDNYYLIDYDTRRGK